MLVSKNAKVCVTPDAKPKISSQWNIDCVGSPTQNFRVVHVHFISLVSILFALGLVFQWNMGLRVISALHLALVPLKSRFAMSILWI